MLRVTYDTRLFDEAGIQQLITHWQCLMENIAAQPDISIGQLSMISDAERNVLLQEWNATAMDYDRSETMHGIFEQQVACKPDAIAVYCDGQTLTYAELNRRANLLAARLQTLGVGTETLVGISVERTLDMIVGLYGVLKAGGAYVPLDPNYPPERVRFMLEDCQAPVLLTQSSLVANLPEHNAEVLCLDTFDWGTDTASNPDAPVSGENLSYVIYTSGSTGKPKGVCIEHRNAVALIRWAETVFSADEWSGVLASTSICFDLSVFEIFCTLGLGGRVVLVSNALALSDLPAEASVSLINTVPSAIAELVRNQGVPDSVNTINLAGEPLSTALVNEIYDLGTVERVNDLYGPSEDTTYSTWTRREAQAPASIGRPIANTRVYLLDASLQPVPIGVPGEIYLAGDGITRGYLNRPELTAEKYLHDPFGAEGEKLYRTGDLARYRHDGSLEYIGRLDHQVKLRGFRIELGEIETALETHTLVETARVIIREDHPEIKQLVAYVVATDAIQIDPTELREHVYKSLPIYMVPQAFITLTEIPLTPNGKLDRKALPTPDRSSSADTKYVPPQNETEEQLAAMWSELLGIEQIGINDDFFSLGGHSLVAMQVVSRIMQSMGVQLPLETMFDSPTIARLAETVNESGDMKVNIPKIQRISRNKRRTRRKR